MKPVVSAPKTKAAPKKSSEDALQGTRSEAVEQSIVQQRQPSIGKVAPQNYGVLPPDANEGLTQTQLCDFYGLSWRNLKRNLAAAGFDSVESYLQQMTGITWTHGKTLRKAKIYFLTNQSHKEET